MGIVEDKNRFLDIVKGKVRDNLKKYVSHGNIIGKQEDKFIKIPMPEIDLPTFRYGSKDNKGVGQGNGKGEGDQVPGDGLSEPGKDAGEHDYNVELSLEDLAQILGESLSLPRLEPKGMKEVQTTKRKYNSISNIGPMGLKNFKASYKKALMRSIVSGVYNPENPMVIPHKKDFRFKSFKEQKRPHTQAVIFYLMDVSGSMGDQEKETVQIEAFWINSWIKKHFKNVEVKFIVHDTQAWEVNEEEFFSISSSGGTKISSAYELCNKIIEDHYPVNDWNIYVFQFSDGDNIGEDNLNCIQYLKNVLLPKVNSFNYGQIQSGHGSGNYIKELKNFTHEKLITSKILGKEGILNSIKDFFKGTNG